MELTIILISFFVLFCFDKHIFIILNGMSNKKAFMQNTVAEFRLEKKTCILSVGEVIFIILASPSSGPSKLVSCRERLGPNLQLLTILNVLFVISVLRV